MKYLKYLTLLAIMSIPLLIAVKHKPIEDNSTDIFERELQAD